MYLLSLLYGLVIRCRNFLYDNGAFLSSEGALPTICIGNLAVGGTGKTPHTEHIARLLTSEGYKLAVLSRGYKRKSKGFVMLDESSTADTVGDEPLQMYKNLSIPVAVDKDRLEGIKKLKQLIPDLQLVILDDAMQYRHLKPSLSILLTSADNLFIDDKMLPLGRLRDEKRSANRADAVVITNSKGNFSEQLSGIDMPVFHSKIIYKPIQPLISADENDKPNFRSPLILTGIATPKKMVLYLKKTYPTAKVLSFPDHHNFSNRDFARMKQLMTDVIITTQKDAMRLLSSDCPQELLRKIYYLPIEVETDIDKFILDKVKSICQK